MQCHYCKMTFRPHHDNQRYCDSVCRYHHQLWKRKFVNRLSQLINLFDECDNAPIETGLSLMELEEYITRALSSMPVSYMTIDQSRNSRK